jgi:hypothetical protein
MEKVADAGEPPVVIPVVVVAIHVDVALVVVPVESECTTHHQWHCPLNTLRAV